MRTQLLVALVLLVGGALAHAQQVPGYPSSPVPLSGVPSAAVPLGSFEGMPIADAGGAPYGGYSGRVGANDHLFWVSGNYLIGWIPKMKFPTPLVTTGLTTDAAPGALRQPGTNVIYGDTIDFDPYQGFQAQFGIFCDEARITSLDVSGFVLLKESFSFAMASDAAGNPVIARPIYNALIEQEGAFIDARPGIARGSVTINADTKMWGGEANVRCHVGNERLRGELLAGFRYLTLEERFQIADELAPLQADTLTFLGGTSFVNAPNSLRDLDLFESRNRFYGGQIGGVLIWDDEWYFLRLAGKVGLGVTQQRMNIGGSSTLVTPTGDTTVEGGIFAVSSNIGTYTRNVFGVIPEWSITGGVYVTNWMRVSAGYSFLLWNRVVRPGDGIDRSVNPAFVPTANSFGVTNTPNRPTFSWNDSSFWVQAVQAGIEFIY